MLVCCREKPGRGDHTAGNVHVQILARCASDEFVSREATGPLRRSAEGEKAEQSHNDQSGTGRLHEGRETICRMHTRCMSGPLRSARVAVDDDLPIEVTIGVQPVGQARKRLRPNAPYNLSGHLRPNSPPTTPPISPPGPPP